VFSITAAVAVFTILDYGVVVSRILFPVIWIMVLAAACLVVSQHGFRYSLRTLFVVLTVWAIFLAAVRLFA